MHELVLEVLSGPTLGSRQLKLDEPRILGRSPECDWVLADPAGQGVEAVRPIRDEIRTRIEGLIAEIDSRAAAS